MAFINLRRKKGIYLGGDTWVAFLFLSPSPRLFLFSRDSLLDSSSYPSVCCIAKPSAAKSARTAPR